ncbi:MAG TPA: FUSC family protein [Janthinobacterium sp.]|nr:FUSC family protein [Janthinobacterium sp.]
MKTATDHRTLPASGPARASAWLATVWRGWAAVEGERWIFVGKALAGAFLALWLAYRLELDSPSTAMTTVFILALPSSGQVLEKAFYRLLGTVAGCAGALLLIGLFPQQAPLLFLGLALWIGLCTCGASMSRNSQSYSFLLAGYTACMIALPAIDQPAQAFTLALTRVTEVSLGILCSAFVNEALFPRHQSAQVLRSVQARHDSFLRFCRDVLERRLSPAEAEVSHMQFAADIAALESGRAAAFFEAIHVRADTRRLHAFNGAFMAALTTFYTLHRLVHRLRLQPPPALELAEPMFAAMAAALRANPAEADLDALRLNLREQAAAAQRSIGEHGMERPQRLDFETAVELLERFTLNLREFQDLYRGLTERRRRQLDDPQPYRPQTPPAVVIASGVRAAVVVLLMALMWYRLNWPYATSAMLMTIVFSALASSSPRPTRLAGQCLAGFVAGLPIAFASVFFVLVDAHGYAMLALCMLPALVIGTYLNAVPQAAGIGIGMNVFMTQTLAPANQLNLDPVAFLNNGMALIVGVALAWVVSKVVLPEHTMGQKDHVAAALWRETLAACLGRRGGLKHRFDNRVRDLLSQLNGAAGPAPDQATRAVVRQALTLLELGHSVIGMRELIATSQPGPARGALRDCVTRIAAYLRRPDQLRCRQAIDAIVAAGLQVRQAGLDAGPERQARLQTALADMHSIHTSLLDQLPRGQPSLALSGEPHHAA